MRYYGCKTKLLNYIEDAVKSLNLKNGAVFFDIFSGTSAVGKHFKKLGYTIYANDFLEFAHAIAKCHIQTNKIPIFKKLSGLINRPNANKVIQYLNELNGKIGFFTKNYSPYKTNERQYVSVENAKKIDAIREQIHIWKKEKLINESEYYYLITSLIEAVNLVSNVTGTYAAYLKSWDNRALKSIKLSPPLIIESDKKNIATKGDANNVISNFDVDVLYLDPPYNSRQFAANYFLLELIAEGWFEKEPEIYGMAGMRPYDSQKSQYSITKKAEYALLDLISKAKAKYILLSYNDEGIIPIDKLRNILGTRGKVEEFAKEHKRYRAINQDGSKIKTKEHLFVVKVKK